MAKLTDSKLKTERAKRKLFDANGLYAPRSKNGNDWWWRLRMIAGKREQHVSLGTYPKDSIDDARMRALTVRKAAKDGDDPAVVAAQLRGAAAPHPVAMKKAPAGDSVEAVVKRWNEWRAANENERAAATAKRNDRCLGYLVNALGPSTSMPSIDLHALSTAITKIKTAHKREMAKRALQLANQLWQYAMHERIVPHNPRSGLNTKFVLGEKPDTHFSAVTEPKPFGALLRTIDTYTGHAVTRIALQLLALLFVALASYATHAGRNLISTAPSRHGRSRSHA